MIIAVVSLFAVSGIQAGTEVEDVIKFENSKGLVEFTHKKHHDEYGAACGECHHDDQGKPRADLKLGDDVKSCKECHKTPGEVPKEVKKEWRDKKLKKEEINKLELEYTAEAYHANCQGCHKDYNKKNKTKAAPTTCTKCHAKEK
jgi:hypothetical protein